MKNHYFPHINNMNTINTKSRESCEGLQGWIILQLVFIYVYIERNILNDIHKHDCINLKELVQKNDCQLPVYHVNRFVLGKYITTGV